MTQEHLSPLDALFLELEEGDENATLFIGAVAELNAEAPSRADVILALLRRLDGFPYARKRVHPSWTGLQPPVWENDPDFDIEHHVFTLALRDEDDAENTQIWQTVADIMAAPLDHSRPLWQFWLIDRPGHAASIAIVKLHHSIADGISAVHILTGLCDHGPPAHAASPARHRQQRAVGVSSVLSGFATRLTRPVTAVQNVAAGVHGLVTNLIVPASKSTLVGPISASRRYSVAAVSLSTVGAIQRRYQVTINDIALTAITTAFRKALIRRGNVPNARQVRVLVPVSVRSSHGDFGTNNKVSVMLPFLPVDVGDVVEQLMRVHSVMNKAKGSGQAHAGQSATSLARFIPFQLFARTVRIMSRFPQRSLVAVATNVPGPRAKLEFLGREVSAVYPFVPIAVHIRTSIGILSYADTLTFGITGDYYRMTDTALFADDIRGAIAELAAAASS
ncbi:wax ester/triacylglycerol synthase family O-acyltransferase [Hoyosella sp. YIM 151337]|uniref:wax ester/triacylglycerol synthase family O-acyltransferase n=1 Tax=Hoyosella sp. YIM 151337 TaxID=2992742 RepID=UPI002235E051|nr:wax ester/triacylglycerol synthase family O-acyltransferase [Hoyosella sp. YIM 151337]MCW4352935.1 wax ester/triacylglycerol synthase family O-acyltransferase [Hoyosella sp. YIM 151337]